ncbi:MAG TPA: 2-oxoglutarate dehydrogenase E1 component [Gemmatimonadaceae bacterium]
MSNLPITSVYNDGLIAETYESYRRDPASVDESWRQFFRLAETLGGGAAAGQGVDASLLRKAAAAASLAGAIQRYGHLAVQLDPLGTPPPGAAELKPEFHGISETDLEALPASALGDDNGGTAADAIRRMREAYCGALAYEFEHLNADVEREWFRRIIESGEATTPLTDDEKRRLLERLTEVDGLERFLGKAYVGVKRFSIEGVDAMVPMLDEAIERSAHGGTRQVVIGAAHRGRLNILTHVMGKPYRTLFGEFEGHHPDTNAESDTGDVKYHMGYQGVRDVPGAGPVELELVPNPSHLEVVNPVVAGVARARQRVKGAAPNTRDEMSVLPIVIHGDASFAGEGIVPETLNMALLNGYRVGGSMHIIANNQVGFTTDPIDARSTHYASDPAKGYEIPIVHVNADDAEACLQAVRLGIAYRQRFNKDFLIDLVGYRRHGHNEADQPAFTQPMMYKIITDHPSPRAVFAARLVRERVATEADVAKADTDLSERLTKIYQEMKKGTPDTTGDDAGAQKTFVATVAETNVRTERLVSLNEQLLTWPSTFKLHPTMQRTLPRRRDALGSGAIDWGHAESLAFASLLIEGTSVRITGQDAERGTFSHRQAVLHDVNTGQTYSPLANLPQASGAFEIFNSPLSETAVLAFEYGFSVAAPDELVLWEAQYGDFANMAQPIVDQFISAGRSKWRQESGLVMLLPHGYEGQGPEHSSARLERYLQLVADDNICVAYPSTPAQYFHILRRQALRRPRRPLVLMQPKSLLRMPNAASKLEDLANGKFQAVIDDPIVSANREQVQRLVFCTGKMYYDLTAAERPANIAIVRIEELAPWPRERISELVDQYPNVEEVVWAQEEPKNMGAWTYAQPRLRASIGTVTTLRYTGRPERASPAEGYKANHDVEQARIIKEVLTYAPASRKKAGAAR